MNKVLSLFALVAMTLIWAVAGAAVASAADSCSNAGLRVAQGSEGLGDCRAYELVSPVDKNGKGVDVVSTVQGAPSGDAVAYASSAAFAGAEQSLITSYYLGRRTTTGWSAAPLEAPQLNRSNATQVGTLYLSEGLESALQVSQAGVLPGAVEGGTNVYLRDNVSGARTLGLATDGDVLMAELADFTVRKPTGASADLKHFAFMSGAQLTPDAAPGTTNVYEVADGQTRLVNRMPDGTVDPGGAEFRNFLGVRDLHPVSNDGRRVIFNAPAAAFPQPLYMRIDGTTTIPLSVSHRTGDSTAPQPARYIGSSDDGTIVYFASEQPLTDDANEGIANGSLYRLDVKTDTLTDLSVVSDPSVFPTINRVLGMSDDGSTIYFSTTTALTADAVPGQPQIYRAGSDGVRRVAAFDLTWEPLGPGQGSYAFSSDFRYFAFLSVSQPTGFDNTNSHCSDGLCSEVYIYDAVSDSLRCASCAEDSGGNRDSMLGSVKSTIGSYASRAVLDDGRVFFTSQEALVPQDVNGKSDVYAWKDGATTLISTGTSEQDALFSEASAGGRDVFFLTSDQLVASDTDHDVDLYDARVGGGLSGQNVRPVSPMCDGDGCQGLPGVLPEPLSTGSAELSGVGTLPDARSGGSLLKHVRVVATSAPRGRAIVGLKVVAPGPGRLRVSGVSVGAVTKSTVKAATYSLAVRLTKKAKASLRRNGKLKVGLRVGFSPASGTPSTATVSVTLRAR